jgi:flagellar biosynthetic protein FliR
MSVLNEIYQHPDYLLLMFLRVSGLLCSSPVFGRKNVPNMAKIGFCLMLTILFINVVPAPSVYPVWTHVFQYGLLCLRELAFGLAMGFVMTTMFDLVLTAGSMMDTQIGFSMSGIYDIQNNTQSPLSGALFDLMLLVLFFGMDGHLRLIDILYSTIQEIPVGTAMVAPQILWAAAKVMSTSFALSVMMAMPVVASGVLTEIALGSIIRTVPQMNMFVVGIPLKIIVGLIVLSGSFAMFVGFSKEITAQTFSLIDTMFSYLGSAG